MILSSIGSSCPDSRLLSWDGAAASLPSEPPRITLSGSSAEFKDSPRVSSECMTNDGGVNEASGDVACPGELLMYPGEEKFDCGAVGCEACGTGATWAGAGTDDCTDGCMDDCKDECKDECMDGPALAKSWA